MAWWLSECRGSSKECAGWEIPACCTRDNCVPGGGSGEFHTYRLRNWSVVDANYHTISCHISVFEALLPIDCSSPSLFFFQSFRLQCLFWLLLMASPCVASVCSVGVREVFCSVLLVWNLLGGPHESRYTYLLPQSSPLAQCTTTCTIQTRLCSIPLWTEDLWGALWHVNLPLFFFLLAREGLEPGTFSVRGRRLTNWAIWYY